MKIIENIKKKFAQPSFRFWLAIGFVKLIMLILLVVFLWMVFGRIKS